MMNELSYLVNEVYPCLQGEGASLGRPSVLVRFQICNLRCTWCDTPYTHTYRSDPDPTNPQRQLFSRMSLADLSSKIRSYHQVSHVILSGGEPTLQNLLPLAKELSSTHTFEVETNGTQIPHQKFSDFTEKDYELFQWNVSPKGAIAGESLVETALAHWASLSTRHQKVFFKFVVRRAKMETDVDEVLSICRRFSISANRVYLMAEGTTVESQLSNEWLHDACLTHGFHYTPRLHVLLFGPKRGV